MSRRDKTSPEGVSTAPNKAKVSPSESVDGERAANSGLVRAEWAGPLPPPSILQNYDTIIENGAERIFNEFEQEAEHRRKLECQAVSAEVRDILLGKIFALVFSLSALGVASLAIWKGAEWVATIIGGGVIATVVLAFLRQNTDKEGKN